MPNLRSPSPVGHTIAARYELLEVIGRGGHGVVFRARDRLSGDVVAVKMLTDVAAQDPMLVERLKREQLVLAQLAGTSAVRVVDLCASPNGRLCLVMELLSGVDLEQHLELLESRRQHMPKTDLARALEPIVDTLEQAHRGGILHRDLKPANIFLLEAGGVRLLDFGLARIRQASPLTAAGTIVGSPSYIAPEVWSGRPDALDQRVDVYSLGVIVYRALSGRLPFEGASLRDKFIQATTAPRPSLVTFRHDLPIALDHWVEQVLAIDRDARFDSVRAAWNALLAALGLKRPALSPALEPSPIVDVGVALARGVFSAPAPERSLVSEMLGRSDLAVEPPPPMATADVAPGLFDSTRAAGEASLVSEWLAASAPAAGQAETLDAALGLPDAGPRPKPARRRRKPRLPVAPPTAAQAATAGPTKAPKKAAKKRAPSKAAKASKKAAPAKKRAPTTKKKRS